MTRLGTDATPHAAVVRVPLPRVSAVEKDLGSPSYGSPSYRVLIRRPSGEWVALVRFVFRSKKEARRARALAALLGYEVLTEKEARKERGTAAWHGHLLRPLL